MVAISQTEYNRILADDAGGFAHKEFVSRAELRELLEHDFNQLPEVPYEAFADEPIANYMGSVNSSKNQLLWEVALASGEAIRFPKGTFFFESSLKPTRRFAGHSISGTILKAQTGFSGNTFVDLNYMSETGEAIRDLYLQGNFEVKFVLGVEAEVAGFKGRHFFHHLQINGATEWNVYFPAGGESSSPGLGLLFLQCLIDAHSGAGNIFVDTAVDDITFINTRMAVFTYMNRAMINVGNTVFNANFINTFMSIAADFEAAVMPGANALINVYGGGNTKFSGMFVEPYHITFARWRHLFSVRSTTMIDNVTLEGGGGLVMPPESGLVRMENGTVDIAGIANGFGANFNTLVRLSGDETPDNSNISFRGVDSFDNVIGLATAETQYDSDGLKRANITGPLNSKLYDHSVISDGTNLVTEPNSHEGAISSPFRQIINYPEASILASDAKVIRLVAPGKCVLNKIKAVQNHVVAGADATIQAAITGVGDLSGGLVTLPLAGTVVGKIAEVELSGTNNDNDLEEGEEVTLTVGGGNTTNPSTSNFESIFIPRGNVRPRNMPAARLDGGTVIRTAAAMTGWVNVRRLTFAMQFKRGNTDNWKRIFAAAPNGANVVCQVGFNGSDQLYASINRWSTSQQVSLFTLTETITDTDYHTVVFQLNGNTAGVNAHAWLDGVDAAGVEVGPLNQDSGINDTSDWGIGGDVNGTGMFTGEIFKLWVSAEELFDFNAQPNQWGKFFDANNNWRFDLPANGGIENLETTNTVVPAIYLNNTDWRNFGVNTNNENFETVVSGGWLKPVALPHW